MKSALQIPALLIFSVLALPFCSQATPTTPDISHVRQQIRSLQSGNTDSDDEKEIKRLITSIQEPTQLAQLIYSIDMGADPNIIGNDKYTLSHMLNDDIDSPQTQKEILQHLHAVLPPAVLVFRGDDTQGDFLAALALAAQASPNKAISFIRVYRANQQKIMSELKLANDKLGLKLTLPTGQNWGSLSQNTDLQIFIETVNTMLAPHGIYLHRDYHAASTLFQRLTQNHVFAGKTFLLFSDVDNTMIETPLIVLDALTSPEALERAIKYIGSGEYNQFNKDIDGDDSFAATVNTTDPILNSLSINGEDPSHFNYVVSARVSLLKQFTEAQLLAAGYKSISILGDVSQELSTSVGFKFKLYEQTESMAYTDMANLKLNTMALPYYIWAKK